MTDDRELFKEQSSRLKTDGTEYVKRVATGAPIVASALS